MVALLSIIMFGAWIWMIVIAFQNEQILWGVLIILFTLLAAFIYGIVHWDKAKKPFLLGIVATVLAVLFIDPDELETTGLQHHNTEIERLV